MRRWVATARIMERSSRSRRDLQESTRESRFSNLPRIYRHCAIADCDVSRREMKSGRIFASGDVYKLNRESAERIA
jgi:hypothetical protein